MSSAFASGGVETARPVTTLATSRRSRIAHVTPVAAATAKKRGSFPPAMGARLLRETAIARAASTSAKTAPRTQNISQCMSVIASACGVARSSVT